MDTTESSVDINENLEQPKFIDEPWKTISNIQTDLKNVDIENKALHHYLTTLKQKKSFQMSIEPQAQKLSNSRQHKKK